MIYVSLKPGYFSSVEKILSWNPVQISDWNKMSVAFFVRLFHYFSWQEEYSFLTSTCCHWERSSGGWRYPVLHLHPAGAGNWEAILIRCHMRSGEGVDGVEQTQARQSYYYWCQAPRSFHLQLLQDCTSLEKTTTTDAQNLTSPSCWRPLIIFGCSSNCVTSPGPGCTENRDSWLWHLYMYGYF